MNSPEMTVQFSSVQFSSGQKILYLASSALSSVQFRSKKRGRIIWTRINAQKRSKNAPKRPKRPKTPQKRPKTPQKRPFFDLKTPVFFRFSSGQFFQVRSAVDGRVPRRQTTGHDASLAAGQRGCGCGIERRLTKAADCET
jgi:hypothetical protein